MEIFLLRIAFFICSAGKKTTWSISTQFDKNMNEGNIDAREGFMNNCEKSILSGDKIGFNFS